MPSPFPGMDPYLEAPMGWVGFHNDLAGQMRAALNEQLPRSYYADLETFVTYDLVAVSHARRIAPDVMVVRKPLAREEPRGGVATLAPPSISLENEVPLDFRIHLDRVEVRAVGTDELVTVVEILSPVNKDPSHPAFRAYGRKRRAMLRSDVHLLEIDLLRAGTRPPLTQPLPPAPYYAMLSRADCRPSVRVWPMQLSERLPILPVPLREPDPDVTFDLGAAVASVYQRGAYDRRIDYTQLPPPPLLTEVERAWMDELLKGSGR